MLSQEFNDEISSKFEVIKKVMNSHNFAKNSLISHELCMNCSISCICNTLNKVIFQKKLKKRKRNKALKRLLERYFSFLKMVSISNALKRIQINSKLSNKNFEFPVFIC